ncbi:MAG: hypothetical protein ABEK17_01900 [Candidatus Aenigmatarchaeota archaeon]
MKAFEKFLTVILLTSIVFLSGCLQGGNDISKGNGLDITNFGTYYPQVESGEDFDIVVDVQNKGGKTARNVYAFLHGISTSKWSVSGSNPSRVASDLQGPDIEMEMEGESDFVTWNLVAPQQTEGVTFTYNPKVRVFYNYKTTASTSVPILDRKEYKRLVSNEENLPKQKVTQITKGPLGVTINSRSPVIAKGGREDFRISIKIQNLENGGIFHPNYINSVPNIPEDRTNEVRLKIDAPDVTPIDCNAYYSPETISIRRGKEAMYNCELEVSNIITRRDVPVRVQLDYGYFIDETTQVKVRGVE